MAEVWEVTPAQYAAFTRPPILFLGARPFTEDHCSAHPPRFDMDCDVCFPDHHVGCIKTTRSHSKEPEPVPGHHRCRAHQGFPVPYRRSS